MFDGMLIEARYWGANGHLIQDKSKLKPAAVDILCQNVEGGALSASKTSGCNFVGINLDGHLRGQRPRVVKAVVAGFDVLGCVHWEHESVADDKLCWVRIFGWHDYALILGHASLALGYPVTIAGGAAGVGTYSATPYAQAVAGFMREAYTTTSNAAKKVDLRNPRGLIF